MVSKTCLPIHTMTMVFLKIYIYITLCGKCHTVIFNPAVRVTVVIMSVSVKSHLTCGASVSRENVATYSAGPRSVSAIRRVVTYQGWSLRGVSLYICIILWWAIPYCN